ncbi:hypothetical protein MMC07_006269 [Pseudocyphellaria aurata]|nr:hypothetical protein [Pseudocyphellaria aurata]
MAIIANGEVESSVPYDVINPNGGKIIFYLVVAILESAMKCFPTVTPAKPVEPREEELGNFTPERTIFVVAGVEYACEPEQSKIPSVSRPPRLETCEKRLRATLKRVLPSMPRNSVNRGR